MTHVITQACVNDTACTVVCPVDAIHPTLQELLDGASTEMLYIDPATCIDCGNCVVECPVGAIYEDHDLPEKLVDYQRINAEFFETWPAPGPIPRRQIDVPVLDGGIVRVAIVGSGPAGAYAMMELLALGGPGIRVDVYDRLPTPWGLARSGVAPDHLSTKGVASTFAEHARDERVRFFLNVEVGIHISPKELAGHYDGVIYAVGASSSRTMGITGEDLPGSHAATEFVAWYNGHPDYANRSFDLDVETAVIVGNGNVALDVARVLTASPEYLAASDIAPHALAALTRSRIRNVVILGRRGPIHAACTTPELRALGDLPGVRIRVDPRDLELSELERERLTTSLPARIKYRLFSDYASREWGQTDRTIEFRFLGSPVRVRGERRVTGIDAVRNRMLDQDGTIRLTPTDTVNSIPTGLVLRSIGYHGVPIPGLPFDDRTGTLPNVNGRVVDPEEGAPMPGVYVAGWMKRGPSGVIGTNKQCSQETVAALLDDVRSGASPAPPTGYEDVEVLLHERRPECFGWDGWRRIDEYEVHAGRALGRPRAKVTDRRQLVAIGTGAGVDAGTGAP